MSIHLVELKRPFRLTTNTLELTFFNQGKTWEVAELENMLAMYGETIAQSRGFTKWYSISEFRGLAWALNESGMNEVVISLSLACRSCLTFKDTNNETIAAAAIA